MRRDGVVKVAQSGHKRDGMDLGMSVGRMILRCRAHAKQRTAQQLRQNFHLDNPPEVDLEFRKPKQSRTGLGDALASGPSLCQIESLAKSSARELCRKPFLPVPQRLLRVMSRLARCSTPSTPTTESITICSRTYRRVRGRLSPPTVRAAPSRRSSRTCTMFA